MTDAAPTPAARRRVSVTVAALTVGTALNPLNSSMIAVALIALRDDFGIDLATVTWVITVFYIASIVGQPLMGRLVDALGARRVFVAGMVSVLAGALLAPLGGSFVLVCVARVLMALGTSAAFPAAMALVGPLSARSAIPTTQLLARIQVSNTAGAALGPVLGGVLVAVAGWQAVFLVNLPLAIAAGVGVALLAPRDTPRGTVTGRALVGTLDPLGVAAFAAGITAVVVVVLDTGEGVQWWLRAGGAVMLALFVWRELAARTPFIDLRLMVRGGALSTAYLAFTVFSTLFYAAFFGLPQFLEESGGYSPALAGVLMLPLAAMTVVLAPIVARIMTRRGARPVLVWGAVLLVPAAAALAIGVVTTAPGWMLVMAGAVGIPYCIVSLAITQIVQRSAPAGTVGAASGLLASTRFIGATVATVILGRVMGDSVTPASWGVLTIVAGSLAVVHLVVVLVGARTLRV